jgi:hypothetical protein
VDTNAGLEHPMASIIDFIGENDKSPFGHRKSISPAFFLASFSHGSFRHPLYRRVFLSCFVSLPTSLWVVRSYSVIAIAIEIVVGLSREQTTIPKVT